MRKTLLAAMAISSLGAMAQVSERDFEFRTLRPEHVVNYVTDATGTRLGMHRVGVPGKTFPLTGAPRIPILLVEFPDRPFYASGKTSEEVLENFDYYFNGFDDDEVYRHVGSIGSVFGYFNDMSRGQFLPDFELIGPIMMDHGYATYGYDGDSGYDANVRALYKEAVTKAMEQFAVDWSKFDNNGDGSVDFLHFIHSGWGQNINHNADKDAIWAKEYGGGMTITLDNGQSVKLACFGISAEARYKNEGQVAKDIESGDFPNGYNPDNMKMDGIGVCLHEMSHALGLPDFYDTHYEAFGMDIWSIMDYGEYCVDGYQPVGYTAYERNFFGWEPLETLTEPQVLTLKCFVDGGVGYKIVNPANPNEYYVIENRQGKGWDTYLGSRVGHGLQVTHVDYNESKWLNNSVNTDAKHQRMTIIAANNSYLGTNVASSMSEWRECLGGQLYPGTTFNFNLTDESTPAATVFTPYNSRYFMSQPLRNITENEDGTVTVCFRTNGKLDVPETNAASDISEHGFTASWEPVENATKYVVEMEMEGESARVDTLSELSISYEDLKASTAARFRVMALADSPEDYIGSDWSEYVYLNTDEDTIEQLPDSEKMVHVYAMNGMPVTYCKASDIRRLFIRTGVYVVKYQNGSTRKVMIK